MPQLVPILRLISFCFNMLMVDILGLIYLLNELLKISINIIWLILFFHKKPFMNSFEKSIKVSRNNVEVLLCVVPMYLVTLMFICLPLYLESLLLMNNLNIPDMSNNLPQGGNSPNNLPQNNGPNPCSIKFMLNNEDSEVRQDVNNQTSSQVTATNNSWSDPDLQPLNDRELLVKQSIKDKLLTINREATHGDSSGNKGSRTIGDKLNREEHELLCKLVNQYQRGKPLTRIHQKIAGYAPHRQYIGTCTRRLTSNVLGFKKGVRKGSHR